MRPFLSAFLLAASIAVCTSNFVSDSDWADYKSAYLKSYSPVAESNARYYFAVNRQRVNTHNDRFKLGLESYQLGVNQYSDLRFLDFAAKFPPTTEIKTNGVPYTVPPNTPAPPPSFSYAVQGFNSPIEDQGQLCNSGWAYASATALHIFSSLLNPNKIGVPLSAQNFIDCAGVSKACTNQVSQAAFDYLKVYKQKVFPIAEYQNAPLAGQGMCILPQDQTNGIPLASYATIPNGNDVLLKAAINYDSPVVIKYNPGTFEFMHYKDGIFSQPAPTQTAAHYMTIVGYGPNYWLLQNSFDTTWGEGGFMRIEMNAAKPISNSAILPYF